LCPTFPLRTVACGSSNRTLASTKTNNRCLPSPQMYSHQPAAYRCPFCNIVKGGEDPRTIVWQDDVCIAAIALHQKIGNLGSLVLFPKDHHENVYVLPENLGAHLFKVTKALSIGVKSSLNCRRAVKMFGIIIFTLYLDTQMINTNSRKV
jgi:hypothetical protein